MATISFRIDEETKKKFEEVTNNMWIDTSTALRFFINEIIKNPDILKFDLDEKLLIKELLKWKELKKKTLKCIKKALK